VAHGQAVERQGSPSCQLLDSDLGSIVELVEVGASQAVVDDGFDMYHERLTAWGVGYWSLSPGTVAARALIAT
jgi:hypothetical protein